MSDTTSGPITRIFEYLGLAQYLIPTSPSSYHPPPPPTLTESLHPPPPPQQIHVPTSSQKSRARKNCAIELQDLLRCKARWSFTSCKSVEDILEECVDLETRMIVGEDLKKEKVRRRKERDGERRVES